MRLFDIMPLTRIPAALPQVLSYFSGQNLPTGALVQIPLGRRKEEGIVVGAHDIADFKMEIKNADFELRNISKILSTEPVLTAKQIELSLFLGQYYFCSPGIFAKIILPKIILLTKSSKPKAKSSTLFLAPTISTAANIAKNHKDAVLWHSELTQKQKKAAWLAIKTGQAQTIIGTRSAVFLPFNNLKEVVIEDEANPNHKSWDMFPHYDTHITAQKLAELFSAKLTVKNIFSAGLKTKNYRLPTIIDMRAELKGGNFSIFSVDLYEAVKDALAKNKQVILFINRRGAANFVLCRDCGYIANCPNCDSPMAYHLINNRPSLFCHHCGAKDIPPKLCPKCKSWRIKTVGSGSQKVEAETKKFFPDAKISRLDGDSAPKPKDQQNIITDFVDKKTDVLITTQIIFSRLAELATAKPEVVGILSADTLLHIPDFRSGERTWQTITALQQLRSKNFIIQTYNPENSVLKYIRDNDYAGFAKEENETRQALNYPPFSQIVKLTFRHRDAGKAAQEAKILQVKLTRVASHPERSEGSKISRNEFGMTNNKHADNIEISATLPAFIPREWGKFVWNIILKFSIFNFQFSMSSEFLHCRNSLLQYVPSNWEIDVDPENLL